MQCWPMAILVVSLIVIHAYSIGYLVESLLAFFDTGGSTPYVEHVNGETYVTRIESYGNVGIVFASIPSKLSIRVAVVLLACLLACDTCLYKAIVPAWRQHLEQTNGTEYAGIKPVLDRE